MVKTSIKTKKIKVQKNVRNILKKNNIINIIIKK